MTKLRRQEGQGADPMLQYHHASRPAPYIMAPVAMLEFDPDHPLDEGARLLRVYLHGLAGRPGWQIYVSQVCRALRLSPARWRAARKQLETQGYYRATRRRGAAGKWEWSHHVYELPQPRADEGCPPSSS